MCVGTVDGITGREIRLVCYRSNRGTDCGYQRRKGLGIEVTLWHFDRETGGYYKQEVK